jgi:hypothetical protein
VWRRRSGLEWIATGEKKADSFTRRFMLMKSGPWDWRGVYCPLASWTNKKVFAYVRLRYIPLPAEYAYMKGGLLLGRQGVSKYCRVVIDRTRGFFPQRTPQKPSG